MRSKLVRGLFVVGAVTVLTSLYLESTPRPAVSGLPVLYLDLVDVPFHPGGGPSLQNLYLPANGTIWNELYPNFGTPRNQQNLIDNGDGVLSIGDILRFGGMDYLTTWAGPTYLMNCGTGSAEWEPNQGPHDNTNPVGETWQEIHPNFGATILITSWSDNGDGFLSDGDGLEVSMNGGPPTTCVITATGCDVTLDPVPVVPNQHATWSALKTLITGN